MAYSRDHGKDGGMRDFGSEIDETHRTTIHTQVMSASKPASFPKTTDNQTSVKTLALEWD